VEGLNWLHLVCGALIALVCNLWFTDEYGSDGAMSYGKETEVLGANSPVLRGPPKIPHNINWGRTKPAMVGSRRLTARPKTPNILLQLIIANKNAFVFQISVVIHTTISKFYNKILYP
jgi:hypothetical protein